MLLWQQTSLFDNADDLSNHHTSVYQLILQVRYFPSLVPRLPMQH